MIVKKNRAIEGKSKAAYVLDLVDYILDPGLKSVTNQVVYSSSRGFIFEGLRAQRMEMMALACGAVRSKSPVNHYMLSWREGERPSPNQVEEAVSIMLDELSLKEHQAIYALHVAGGSYHLHLVVNRVHPETEKLMEANRGFDIEGCHRAIARIEHLQGWQREQHGRYQVLEGGKLRRAERQGRAPSQKAWNIEVRTGERSAERIAIEEAAVVLRAAKSWGEVHRSLAEHGMQLQTNRGGAVLWVGQTPVKASSAGRGCSLSALQKRLGQFEAVQAMEARFERQGQPMREDDGQAWSEYIARRKAHYAEKGRECSEQQTRQDAERQELSASQREQRSRILGGDWSGRGVLLNAMRSVLGEQQAAERGALKEKHQRERKTLRHRFPRFPDFEDWLRDRGAGGL